MYIKGYISGRAKYDYRLFGAKVADMMDKDAVKDLIDEFKSGLIAKATNGDISEKDYKRFRDTLLNIQELKTAFHSLLRVITQQAILEVICKRIILIMPIDEH